MKLYLTPMSPNSRKPYLVAKHLDLDLETQVVDLMAGEQKSPEFIKLNPNTKTPVLEDGETVLWESNAIMCYLASKKDNSLWPRTALRYQIMKWQNWESCHWSPAVTRFAIERVMKKGGPDAAVGEQAETDFARFAAVLNGQLETTKHVAGDDLTLADFSIASHLMYAEASNLPLQNFNHIRRWFEGIEQLEAWKATEPPA